MSRPISFECSQNGCEEFGVASDSGVLFDVQSLFEGKRLTNTQTQLWACCMEHKVATLKYIKKDVCFEDNKGPTEESA